MPVRDSAAVIRGLIACAFMPTAKRALRSLLPPPVIASDTVYLSDCITGMRRMTDESVDLIVSDPPYLINYATGHRQEDYGSPENNFGLVAAFWNAYLRPCMRPNIIGIDSKDVAAMLGLLKIARIATGHGKADNWIDLAGYAACGGELERAEEATRSEGDERT